jgi:hypothetical protein
MQIPCAFPLGWGKVGMGVIIACHDGLYTTRYGRSTSYSGFGSSDRVNMLELNWQNCYNIAADTDYDGRTTGGY